VLSAGQAPHPYPFSYVPHLWGPRPGSGVGYAGSRGTRLRWEVAGPVVRVWRCPGVCGVAVFEPVVALGAVVGVGATQ
jgi:hypothetical protein